MMVMKMLIEVHKLKSITRTSSYGLLIMAMMSIMIAGDIDDDDDRDDNDDGGNNNLDNNDDGSDDDNDVDNDSDDGDDDDSLRSLSKHTHNQSSGCLHVNYSGLSPMAS